MKPQPYIKSYPVSPATISSAHPSRSRSQALHKVQAQVHAKSWPNPPPPCSNRSWVPRWAWTHCLMQAAEERKLSQVWHGTNAYNTIHTYIYIYMIHLTGHTCYMPDATCIVKISLCMDCHGSSTAITCFALTCHAMCLGHSPCKWPTGSKTQTDRGQSPVEAPIEAHQAYCKSQSILAYQHLISQNNDGNDAFIWYNHTITMTLLRWICCPCWALSLLSLNSDVLPVVYRVSQSSQSVYIFFSGNFIFNIAWLAKVPLPRDTRGIGLRVVLACAESFFQSSKQSPSLTLTLTLTLIILDGRQPVQWHSRSCQEVVCQTVSVKQQSKLLNPNAWTVAITNSNDMRVTVPHCSLECDPWPWRRDLTWLISSWVAWSCTPPQQINLSAEDLNRSLGKARAGQVASCIKPGTCNTPVACGRLRLIKVQKHDLPDCQTRAASSAFFPRIFTMASQWHHNASQRWQWRVYIFDGMLKESRFHWPLDAIGPLGLARLSQSSSSRPPLSQMPLVCQPAILWQTSSEHSHRPWWLHSS